MFPTCDPIHHMVFSDVDGKVCNLLLYIYMSINICGISTFIAFNLWILFNFYGNLWKIIYILTWGPQTLKSHMGIKDLKQTSQKDLYLHVHIFSPWVCRINFLDKDKLHNNCILFRTAFRQMEHIYPILSHYSSPWSKSKRERGGSDHEVPLTSTCN